MWTALVSTHCCSSLLSRTARQYAFRLLHSLCRDHMKWSLDVRAVRTTSRDRPRYEIYRSSGHCFTALNQFKRPHLRETTDMTTTYDPRHSRPLLLLQREPNHCSCSCLIFRSHAWAPCGFVCALLHPRADWSMHSIENPLAFSCPPGSSLTPGAPFYGLDSPSHMHCDKHPATGLLL